MPIHVEWFNAGSADQKVVHFRFEGEWTLDDYYPAVSRLYQLTASAVQPVDVLFDLSQSHKPPSNMMAATGLMATFPPTNSRYMVVVGTAGFTQRIVNAARRISGLTTSGGVRRADTLDEALQILNP